MQDYCMYYQATVTRTYAWFFVAIVRSYEHMMFDRTIDNNHSIFEFFVPNDMHQQFIAVMHSLEEQGIVTQLRHMPNRLMEAGEFL